MTRTWKITYWIATIWLSLGMISTGIVQLLRQPADVEMMAELGYPSYLLSILGVWKILGVIAILVPGFPTVKEWAYAGFFFAMSGAVMSHLASGHYAFGDVFPPFLLIILTIVSWYLRPPSRRIVSATAEVEHV